MKVEFEFRFGLEGFEAAKIQTSEASSSAEARPAEQFFFKQKTKQKLHTNNKQKRKPPFGSLLRQRVRKDLPIADKEGGNGGA